MKKIFFYIIVFILISCKTNENKVSKSTVNTKINRENKASRKSFSGRLNNSEYDKLISEIEKELNTKIPEGKSLLVNYNQKASNCISLSFSENDISIMTDNRIRISSEISSKNNMVDFFVYSNNAFHKSIYQQRKKFILDSGFFYDNIFTLHENCEAFLILKPNRKYLKFYGEDYYTEVSKFIEKDN